MRLEALAATGHRWHKVKGLTEKDLQHLAEVYIKLEFPYFCISGMAVCWDTAFALAALALEIPLIAAIPFKEQESLWPKTEQVKYHEILSRAHEVVYVNDGSFATWKFQTRNQWMVDRCTKLLALWDGSGGGTANCIRYAQAMGKPYINVWEEALALRT